MRQYRGAPRPLAFVAILAVLAFLALGSGPCEKTTVDTTYSVSGRVTVKGTDTGVYNASVMCGSFGVAHTDSYGYWSKSGLQGQVNVSAAKDGWTFTPPSIPVSSAASNVNFQGQERDYKGLSKGAAWNYDLTLTMPDGVSITGSYSLRVTSVESSGSSTLFYTAYSGNLFSLSVPVDSVLRTAEDWTYIIKRTGSTYYWLEDSYSYADLLFTAPLAPGASFLDDALLMPSTYLTVQNRQSISGYSDTWYCYARDYEPDVGTWIIWRAWFAPYTGVVRWTAELEAPPDTSYVKKIEVTLRSYSP